MNATPPPIEASSTPTAPILRAAHVPCRPEQAFALFTDDLGAWWPLVDHGLYGRDAVELGIDAGLLVERAADGRTCTWGEVRVWDPPSQLVISWHPGRDAADASEVQVRFIADADGTRVELTHQGWERFGVDAVARRRGYTRPGAWGHVLDHFCDLAESALAADRETSLQALEAAAEDFLGEAQRGGFGSPPPGEWDALSVIAHVALSDQTLAAVSRALVHGLAPTMDNTWCQDPDVLAATIARHDGDLDRLIEWAREQARTARLAAARLDPEQRETLVPCRLLHDGQVVVDEPRAWGALAITAQTVLHLPAHTGQLRDLRGGGPAES